MIVFAHTKFGLVRIQGSGVKRGSGIRPPRSERVFQIPIKIGLRVKQQMLRVSENSAFMFHIRWNERVKFQGQLKQLYK